MASINDLYYVNKVKAGDFRAFSEIVSRYKNKIFNIVFRVVENREDAEDLTQEVFIKVFKSIDKFREQAEFSTWLYRVAYNTTISEVRKRKLNFVSLDNTQNVDVSEPMENSETLDKEKQIELLNQALKTIMPDDAFMVSLFYMENKSMNEIADIFDISLSNVKVKLYRIRKKLEIEISRLMKENE